MICYWVVVFYQILQARKGWLWQLSAIFLFSASWICFEIEESYLHPSRPFCSSQAACYARWQCGANCSTFPFQHFLDLWFCHWFLRPCFTSHAYAFLFLPSAAFVWAACRKTVLASGLAPIGEWPRLIRSSEPYLLLNWSAFHTWAIPSFRVLFCAPLRNAPFPRTPS